MSGTLIVTLDCEGKWGFADKITEHHNRCLTEESLVQAYTKLLGLFDKHQVSATFAFVMAFTLSQQERTNLGLDLKDIEVAGLNWLRTFRTAEANGQLGGWFCPRVFDLTQERQMHEIACHGFCHVPFIETSIAAEIAESEITLATKVARSKGATLETFVYPRNQIGYRHILRQHGFIGYRECLENSQNNDWSRALSLIREVDVLGRAQPHLKDVLTLCRIPSGYFFNWRHGARRMVPRWATTQRWMSILRDAANRERVAHLWLHPHNIIDGPTTYDVLNEVLRFATVLRDNGSMNIMTQAEYVRSRRSDGPAGMHQGSSKSQTTSP